MTLPDNWLEEWKPIAGYEGQYEVSNLGRVRSLERSVRTKGNAFRVVKPRIMKLTKNPKGYLSISLANGLPKRRLFFVHRLVAQAFIPNPEVRPIINHIDNNPANNHVNNLEWCNHSENLLHAIRQGRAIPVGERRSNAKMDEEKIREMRQEYANGASQISLARKFGLTDATVNVIVKGKTWKHVI